MTASNEDRNDRLSKILSAVDQGRTSPDKEYLQRLREQSMAAFEASSADNQDQSQTTGASVWRMIMGSRVTKFAAAAAIIIVAIVAGIYQFGGTIDGAGMAWADVVEPILNARTATYTIIIGTEGEAPAIHDMVRGLRIRRTVEGIDAVSVIDLETWRVLTLEPSDNTATYVDLKGLPKQMQNPLEKLQKTIADLQESPHFVVEELGEREIDGSIAVGFRATHPKVGVTIWADRVTGLPIRIEQQEGQMHLICKDFRFDVDLDESLFSMDVPEGYKEQEVELDLFGSTEQDFIDGLRLWTELLGDGDFPDDVSVESFVSQTQRMQTVFAELDASDDEKLQLGMKLNRYLLFIRFFQGEGAWHYAGKGVALGDAETAIFWYRPKGSDVYRVIYGDLTVHEAAPEDLPEPLEAEDFTQTSLGVQQWSRPDLVGLQEDEWHIVAPGEIEAHSFVTLTKMPRDTSIMPITLPYPKARLTVATLGSEGVSFAQTGEGRYELELPLDRLLQGNSTIEVVWTLPLDALATADGGYRTVLKSLIPVGKYKLTIILSPTSGFEHTPDPSVDRFVPFTWGSRSARSDFGSCGISIEQSD